MTAWLVLASAIVALGLVALLVELRTWMISRREAKAARARRRWIDLNRDDTDAVIAAMLESATARIDRAKRESWIAPELRIR